MFFTAPINYVTVVKSMSITIGSTVLTASAWIEDDEGGKLLWAHATGTPTSSPFTLTDWGMWVMLPGETLAAATDAPTIADFYASGYLLAAP